MLYYIEVWNEAKNSPGPPQLLRLELWEVGRVSYVCGLPYSSNCFASVTLLWVLCRVRKLYCLYCHTVLIRLLDSRTSIIQPSIIRLGNLIFQKMGVSLKCTCAVTMETGLLIVCACADNHVTLLFINKMDGSRRGLSIRLSGVFSYLACLWN